MYKNDEVARLMSVAVLHIDVYFNNSFAWQDQGVIALIILKFSWTKTTPVSWSVAANLHRQFICACTPQKLSQQLYVDGLCSQEHFLQTYHLILTITEPHTTHVRIGKDFLLGAVVLYLDCISVGECWEVYSFNDVTAVGVAVSPITVVRLLRRGGGA